MYMCWQLQIWGVVIDWGALAPFNLENTSPHLDLDSKLATLCLEAHAKSHLCTCMHMYRYKSTVFTPCIYMYSVPCRVGVLWSIWSIIWGRIATHTHHWSNFRVTTTWWRLIEQEKWFKQLNHIHTCSKINYRWTHCCTFDTAQYSITAYTCTCI